MADQIAITLSGNTIICRGWDGRMPADQFEHSSIAEAFNNRSVTKKAGRGYTVTFTVERPAAEELLKDIESNIDIYQMDRDPANRAWIKSMQNDAQKIKQSLA